MPGKPIVERLAQAFWADVRRRLVAIHQVTDFVEQSLVLAFVLAELIVSVLAHSMVTFQ